LQERESCSYGIGLSRLIEVIFPLKKDLDFLKFGFAILNNDNLEFSRKLSRDLKKIFPK